MVFESKHVLSTMQSNNILFIAALQHFDINFEIDQRNLLVYKVQLELIVQHSIMFFFKRIVFTQPFVST